MRLSAKKPIEIGKVLVGRDIRICASIIGNDESEVLELINRANAADLIEIRLDGFNKINPAITKRVLRTAKIRGGYPIIATNRMEAEGGSFPGSERDRIENLIAALEIADAIDIELRSQLELRDGLIEKAKEKRIPTIVSYHNFERMPPKNELLQILDEEVQAGASIAKIAVMTKSLENILTVLDTTLLAKARVEIPVSIIAMGEIAKHARVITPIYGSDLIYAAVDEGRSTAPGQLTVQEVREALGILT